MSDSEWRMQNGTLSHKNAMKEFGLSEEQIIQGMRSGKLQYRQNYAHGNPYYRVLRSEVEKFTIELNGIEGVQKQKIAHQLKEINKRINSLKRKLKSLEKEKDKLIEIQNS
jgi:hypothetical protein